MPTFSLAKYNLVSEPICVTYLIIFIQSEFQWKYRKAILLGPLTFFCYFSEICWQLAVARARHGRWSTVFTLGCMTFVTITRLESLSPRMFLLTITNDQWNLYLRMSSVWSSNPLSPKHLWTSAHYSTTTLCYYISLPSPFDLILCTPLLAEQLTLPGQVWAAHYNSLFLQQYKGRLKSYFHEQQTGCKSLVLRFCSIHLISPDLAPSDYHLFGPLTRCLAGCWFKPYSKVMEAMSADTTQRAHNSSKTASINWCALGINFSMYTEIMW